MTRTYGSESTVPDTMKFKEAGDVRSLIRLLNSTDPRVQWHAAEALGTCGEEAVPLLLEALQSPLFPCPARGNRGAGDNPGSPGTVTPLIAILDHDRSLEVRWAAVLALGEIGSPDAIPFLVPCPAEIPTATSGTGRQPPLAGWAGSRGTRPIRAYLLIARQDWEQVRHLGAAALPSLWEISRDDDPATREAIVSVLGQIGDRDAQAACQKALKDRDPRVRWKAVLASMNCGLASHDLPLMVAGRERTGPDPAAAALLNFLFLGIGYNYLGKWWGFPVFMTYMSVLVLAQLAWVRSFPTLSPTRSQRSLVSTRTTLQNGCLTSRM